MTPPEFKYLSQIEIAIGAILTLWPYLLAATTTLMAGLLWAKKMGWIHVGKELERRKNTEICDKHCGEHGTLTQTVTAVGTRVNGLEKKIDKVEDGQNRIETKIDVLVGKVSSVYREVK